MSDLDHPVQECARQPCPDCPWRITNRGRRSTFKVEGEPYGWFAQKNRDRLWGGMRRGEAMTCHPTDPRHPGVPEDATTKECAGALILQQRELMVLDAIVRDHPDDWCKQYRLARPGGLTREGAMQLLWNNQIGHAQGAALMGCRPMGRPDLQAEVEVAKGKLPWPAPGIVLRGQEDEA